MKVLRETLILIIMFLILSIVVCYAQNSTEIHYNNGIKFAVQGKFKEAKFEFNKALKIDPIDVSSQESLETIENVIAKKIGTKEAIHNFRGVDYANKERFNDAIAEFNKAIEINQGFSVAYANKGDIYFRKGQYDQSILYASKAIKINPNISIYYSVRGNSYVQKRKYDHAISDFTKAIKLNPNRPLYYYNRGHMYFQKYKFDKAISDFTKTIKLSPNFESGSAYNNRAICYYEKKEYKKAWSDVNKAKELGYQVHPGFLQALREVSGK